MRVLVTGALGFVGRHLVHHLQACGDDVVPLDRHAPDPVDITDGAAVRAAITAARPEAVYHLAGWADVGASWSDPLAVLRVNAEGTLNVLEASREAHVERVLAVASADVYGIARAERDGKDTVAVGNLTPRRDVTDVRDVVRAYRLLVEQGEPGEVYNVCSGRDLAIQELADRLVALADRPLTLVADPALMRPIDLPVLRGDASKLRAATGWEPQIPVEQTLSDLLDDLRTRERADDPTTLEAT